MTLHPIAGRVRGVTEAEVRSIVRSEIASLAGKAMRRLQDDRPTRSFTRNEATDAAQAVLGHFWGEVLAEYGGDRLEGWPAPKGTAQSGGIAADYAESAE